MCCRVWVIVGSAVTVALSPCRVQVKQEQGDGDGPTEPAVPIPGLDLVDMDVDEAMLVEESESGCGII